MLHIPVLKKIPFQCKILATKIFAQAFAKVVAAPNNNLDSWAVLHMVLLRVAPRNRLPASRKKFDRNRLQANYTLARLRRWNSGPVGQSELWNEILQVGRPASFQRPRSQADINVRRCK